MALYKKTGAKRGQATLGEKYASATKSFAGSAAKGYTVPAGHQMLSVLVIGSVKLEFFAKAAMVSQAEADGMLYKIAGAKCGQATLFGRGVRLGCVVLRWPVGGHLRRAGLHRACRRPGAERAGHRLDQG